MPRWLPLHFAPSLLLRLALCLVGFLCLSRHHCFRRKRDVLRIMRLHHNLKIYLRNGAQLALWLGSTLWHEKTLQSVGTPQNKSGRPCVPWHCTHYAAIVTVLPEGDRVRLDAYALNPGSSCGACVNTVELFKRLISPHAALPTYVPSPFLEAADPLPVIRLGQLRARLRLRAARPRP